MLKSHPPRTRQARKFPFTLLERKSFIEHRIRFLLIVLVSGILPLPGPVRTSGRQDTVVLGSLGLYAFIQSSVAIMWPPKPMDQSSAG